MIFLLVIGLTMCLVTKEGSSLGVDYAYPFKNQEIQPQNDFEYEYFYDEVEPELEFPEFYDDVSFPYSSLALLCCYYIPGRW